MTIPNRDEIARIISDRRVRVEATRESHLLFFAVYFSHYITHQTAAFQREMFGLSEREDLSLLVFEAFRGSAKSTIMTMSLPIWAVLGRQQKKFVLLLSQTQKQAKQHFMNVRREFEGNALLRRDLGPFRTEEDEWGSALVLPKYGAKITFASTEQSIRGIRHGPHRPDLIVCDDVEDTQSAKTKDGRDKIERWFTGEVVPCGTERTLIVVVGNLVHEDGLIARLRDRVRRHPKGRVAKRYPLVDRRGRCLWKTRYPTKSEVEELRARVGSEVAWQREYLLRIIPDEDRVIQRKWIQYYDGVPDFAGKEFVFGVTAIDLAISEKRYADKTAMVSAAVFRGRDGARRIYVLPRPINARMDFPKSLACAKDVAWAVIPGKRTELVVESVAFQMAYVQELKRQGFEVHPYDVRGRDKRTRLALTSAHVESGTVLFPREGSKELIDQLVNFGIEKHDDLADAFSMCVDYAMTRKISTFRIAYLDRPEPVMPRYSLGDVFGRYRQL